VGKDRPSRQRHPRIHQDEVEIPEQPPVLKSVVKNERRRLELLASQPAGLLSSGSNDDRHAGQMPRQELGFIRQPISSGSRLAVDQQPALPVEQPVRPSGLPPVATREDADPQAALQEPGGERLDARRLARPAQREVPDADDRTRKTRLAYPAPVVGPVAGRDSRPVEQSSTPEQSAQEMIGE